VGGPLAPKGTRICTDDLARGVANGPGEDLDGIVTYGDRFAEAARSNGVAVTAPS